MRLLLFLLSFLFTNIVIGQEIKIGEVQNKIEIGDLAGNRDLAFGVSNVLEEVIQDIGYDLNHNSNLEITVDILFIVVQKSNLQISVYSKKTDTYMLAARATLYKDGKKKKQVTATGEAKSISTATLLVDEGGQFSQQNVSTAIKKVVEELVKKLKL